MQADAPSDTAVLIGRCVLLAAEDGELCRLVEEGEAAAVERMLGKRAVDGWFAALRRRPWARRLAARAERVLLPGISAHYLARKRWIEARVRESLQAGVRQLVVVGAGFDALAWRLAAEREDLACFELDHPATQAAKRQGLGERRRLQMIPLDLAGGGPSKVLDERTGFDPGQPAIVVAEGLTMYFEESRVRELLGSLAEVAGPEGRVVFTFMEQAEDGAIGFRGESSGVAWWLRWRREPFRWGIRRTELASFLEGCGLRAERVADHDTLREEILEARGLASRPLARGECLCSARLPT